MIVISSSIMIVIIRIYAATVYNEFRKKAVFLNYELLCK